MINGSSLANIMLELGYSDNVVTQLSFAELHGNSQTSLENIEAYLLQVNHIKKKTLEVITYPIVLLVFLVIIMLGLRQYLLPSLKEGNAITQLLTYFPQLLVCSFLSILFTGLLMLFIKKRSSPLKLISFISRLPVLGQVFQLYMTAYFAREWGNLIGQGLELSTILNIMIAEKSQLVRELGQEMKQSLIEGIAFDQKVLDYPFFKDELSLIISYGQIKSKLGKELEIYAKNTMENYFRLLIQATQIIQPIIFLIVALVIVMIYAAMLLPIYQNMGGHI